MRNIFDQYSQPENKLTHALVCCLHEDQELLKSFLTDFLKFEIKNIKDIKIVEQTFPDNKKEDLSKDENKLVGLPDALIYVEGEWCIVIENKISCGLTEDQLERHIRSVKRYDFKQIYGVTFTISSYQFGNESWKHIYWTDFYTWLRRLKTQSKWVTALIEYLEVLEMKLVNDEYLAEGTLTTFAGIPFNEQNPYNYPEAKRLLRLLMNNLRRHKELESELYLDLNDPGRSAISNGHLVWDYIPVKSNGLHFTQALHFSVCIGMDDVGFSMVLPDKLESKIRKKIKDLGYERFKAIVKDFVAKAEGYFKDIDGAAPVWGMGQRRWYKSINSDAVTDAVLDFDLRTAFEDFPGNDNQAIKVQEQWLKAAYDAFCNKRSNIQAKIGLNFPYSRAHDVINSPRIETICVESWLCCKDFLREIYHA